MEMENFKATLNKINNEHNFIKCSDLEQGKPYVVKCFKKIDTMFGKRLSVVLNDDDLLTLPDRYTNEFTEEQITMYNDKNSKIKFNLIYNEKKLKNGKKMHVIKFE